MAAGQERGEEGIWVEFEDARFLIRSTHSKAYRKAIQKAAKGKSNHRLTRDLDVAENFGIEAMADGLLLDWENVTENGTPLECTRENRVRMLKLAPPIREFLAAQAQDYANFEMEAEEDDAATFRGVGEVADPLGPDSGPADRSGD